MKSGLAGRPANRPLGEPAGRRTGLSANPAGRANLAGRRAPHIDQRRVARRRGATENRIRPFPDQVDIAAARRLQFRPPDATATGSLLSEAASDEQHDAAHPRDRRAFRRRWLREDCAHFQVADRRETRPHAATTDRGPRAHGSLFVPRLHRGTHDEPRATRPAPGPLCGSLPFREVHRRPQPRGHRQCRARCSRNRR
jgi:hypothetical protein